MKTEIILKYILWISFFLIAIAGIYSMLKRLGVLN